MDKQNKPCLKGCIKPSCKTPHEVTLQFVVPTEIEDEEIKELISYFLYRAPNIESYHSSSIRDKEAHREIFREMTNNIPQLIFRDWNYSIKKDLQRLRLADDSICLYCMRAIYKKKKDSNETELECFLRHIRNSIAHGRVVYLHENNKHHIMFSDVRDGGNISAQIICNKTSLKRWKSILSKYSSQS